MVTLATSRIEQRLRNSDSPLANRESNDADVKELHFSLAHNLQATLELEKTLETFFSSLHAFVYVDGLHYQAPAERISVRLGTVEAHMATYRLADEEHDLGSIAFGRAKPFIETELTVLEMLIGILYRPLRNALLYRSALRLSTLDRLTEIGNRAAFEQSFDREIKLSIRHQKPLSLVLIDVDHFKNVNDNLGHQNGDKVLKGIASAIQEAVRETDQVFRYGGEEFVALLSNTTLSHAKLVAQRIRKQVGVTPISLTHEDLLCTVSLGVSHYQADETPEQFFERADAALYLAKEKGRDRVECASGRPKTC